MIAVAQCSRICLFNMEFPGLNSVKYFSAFFKRILSYDDCFIILSEPCDLVFGVYLCIYYSLVFQTIKRHCYNG